MNIQVVFNPTQMQEFARFLENELHDFEPKGNAERIVQCLMVKLYKKVKQKCIVIEQQKYTMSVEPETALAFIEFVVPVTLDRQSYQGNLVQTILNSFHKQTA